MKKAQTTPSFGRGQGIPNSNDNMLGGKNAPRGRGPHKVQTLDPTGIRDTRPMSADNGLGAGNYVTLVGSGKPVNASEG